MVMTERFGARDISIFLIYSLFNGEPFGATNRVSQPSMAVGYDVLRDRPSHHHFHPNPLEALDDGFHGR